MTPRYANHLHNKLVMLINIMVEVCFFVNPQYAKKPHYPAGNYHANHL